MSHTPTTLGSSALKPVIARYYKELERYQEKADYELALRPAFQNMLADAANFVNWTLVLEQKLEGNIRPDGVLRDSFDLRRGFWEAKGPKSDLESDPNNLDDEEYVVRLVGKVVTVSVETVKLVNELAQAVRMEDWLDEMVEVSERREQF